jgi:hypothetical protein
MKAGNFAPVFLLTLIWFAPARAAEQGAACAYLTKQMAARPAGALFLPSYPSVKDGPLKDAAYLYDNAVAVVALVGCGNIGQARRIGDAILFALDHDRFWKDGRLRNAYLAGRAIVPPVKLPGWWEPKQNSWVEDRYQAGSDSGNMAWAILALLAVHQGSGDARYRDGAARIGEWLLQWSSSKGFTGGAISHEPKPVIVTWKSTEHNTDIAAAFLGLARATGDKAWAARAKSAGQFVESMWLADCRCFAAGTGRDGLAPNKLVALDAQLWPLMALPGMKARHGEAAKTAARKLPQSGGLAYSEALKGLWTEGTAQAALYFKLAGDKAAAGKYEAAVQGMRQKDGSYLASSSAELPTGFMLETDPTQPRQYFRMPHLAAASWAALAAQGYNPFTRGHALP